MRILRVLKITLPVICMFALFSPFTDGEAMATTYYVSPAGSDNNSGSASTPFKTIQKAVNSVVAGDTVMVRAGTYNGSVLLTKSGTTGNYITLQNYPGENVYVTTNSGASYAFYGVDISYFKIIGLKIHTYTGYGILFRGGGSHLEIRNNEIYNKQSATPYEGTAIRVEATKNVSGVLQFNTYTDVIIDGNYIHDTWSGDARYEGELLTVAFDVHRFQITNNILSNAYHIGIDCIGYHTWNGNIVDAYPDGGIISGNTLTNIGTYAEDSSIYIDGGKNITIENNTLISNSGAGTGISVSTEDSTGTTENIIIRRNKVRSFVRNTYIGATNGITKNSRWVHNTFIMDDSDDYANASLLNGTGNIVKNNISYASAGDRQLEHVYNKTYSVTFNYNDWYTGNKWFGYGGNGLGYTNFANFQAGTGQESNGISLDPKFTDISSNNLTLLSASPCIDAGGFLTKTTFSGSDQTLVVEDARYFTDGYGVTAGDLIQVGSNGPVRITAVNYATNTITLANSISWNKGDGVSYPYSGSAPDIGAYEYDEYGGSSSLPSGDTTSPAPPIIMAIQ